MSMLTHLVGAIAALAGSLLLLWLVRDDSLKFLSLLIYGGSMVALYSASTLLHGIKLPEVERFWLNRLDHMAIFLLIAGTYTPILTTFFPDPWRWLTLVLVWGTALIGMGYKLFSPRIHGFFNASIYLILSWGSILPLILAGNLFSRIPLRGFLLLLFGGLIYSVGFVIYYRQWPDPWPEFFGHHEIWHLFVLGGSFFHYLFMLFYVALS